MTSNSKVPEEDLNRRHEALETSFKKFEFVSENMRDVYGLRLPRTLAVLNALFASMSPTELEGCRQLSIAPAGIMTWFTDGGIGRKTIDNLDERLQHRYRTDPPEFVPFMHELHRSYCRRGFWYDDPEELPSFVVTNFGGGSPCILDSNLARTPLEEVRSQVDDLADERSDELQAFSSLVTWFSSVDQKAADQDGAQRWAGVTRGKSYDSSGPAAVVPANSGNQRTSQSDVALRAEIYKNSDLDQLKILIQEAKTELASNKPAFALTLGRELHWLDVSIFEDDILELLCGAYEQLGRHALADLTRVHLENRDIPSVDIYADSEIRIFGQKQTVLADQLLEDGRGIVDVVHQTGVSAETIDKLWSRKQHGSTGAHGLKGFDFPEEEE